jgi:hypothetical protein
LSADKPSRAVCAPVETKVGVRGGFLNTFLRQKKVLNKKNLLKF